MNFNIHKFFDYNYLFSQNPSENFAFLLPLAVIFALMLLVGLIVPFWLKRKFKKNPPYHKLQGKIRVSLISFSIIGFLLLFFRNQSVPFLSSRILLFVFFLCFLYWIIALIIYLKKDFQKDIVEYQEQMRKMRYFKGPRAGR